MDIFTQKIPKNDNLWRLRAYLMGLLYSDGSIRTENGYAASFTQHMRDYDIIQNVQKALEGKISGPYEGKIYHVNAYGKILVNKIKSFGMKERHTQESVARNFEPP